MDCICAVQTFRNSYSGYMMYFFAKYYLTLNYTVIIYDRFGAHEEFIRRLLDSPNLIYHNYTVLSLLFPEIYNVSDFLTKPGATAYKVYYYRENNNESNYKIVFYG